MDDQWAGTARQPFTAGKKPVASQAARGRRVAVRVGAATVACLLVAAAASRAFSSALPTVFGERGGVGMGTTLSWPAATSAQRSPLPEAAASGGPHIIDKEGDGDGGGSDDGSGAGAAAALPPPPPLAASFRLPLDAAPPPDELYDVPRVMAALAFPRIPSPSPSRTATNMTLPPPARPPSQMALALYVQGSFRKHKAAPIHMRVTHCLVGGVAVPLSRQFESVWVCAVDDSVSSRVRHGDALSVLVDEDRPLRRGNWTALEGAVLRGVTRRERIPLAKGGVAHGLVVTTTVRWGETVNPDPPAAAAASAAAAAAASAGATAAVTDRDLDARDDSHAGNRDDARNDVRGGAPPYRPPPITLHPFATGVHRVCAMMQSIYKPSTAVAWMEYHARLGVDRLFLYSNVANSTDVAAEVATSPVGDAIEVVHWPWRRSQVAAGHHFLAAARGRCQWVLLCDVDEWLLVREPALPPPPALPPRHRYGHHRGGGGEEETPQPPLLRALAALNASTGASTFVVPAVRMGSGGRVENPHIPYPDAYTYRVEVPGPGKPIALTADTFPLTHVHTVHLRAARARMTKVPGVRLRQPSSLAAAATSATELVAVTNTTPRAVAAGTSPDDIEEPLAPLVMVHYSTRSWVEEVAKRDAGRAAEEMGDFNNGHRRHAVTDPNDPSLAARRTRHLSLDGQTPWTEMRDAWRDVMRRPLRAPIVVPAEDDASRLTDWVDQPSLVPK